MIREVEVSGFKRFTHQSFSMKPLTILAGLNGSGKTSFLQALLMSHIASKCKDGDVVPLNGPYGLQLGTAQDILNWNGIEAIAFKIDSDQGGMFIDFNWQNDEDMYLVAKIMNIGEPLSLAPRGFTYISAERHGPRLSHEGCALPDGTIEVGHMGQHCAQVLATIGNKSSDDDQLHPDSSSPSLLKYEVEKWLSEIARPVELDATRLPNTTMYTLKYRSGSVQWVQATNMGFGVTYSLPIILAGLTAPKGGVILVENPEAHLHAQGQSRMGAFLAWVAGRGVQVIVETHSDHILNGIRKSLSTDSYIHPTDAIVHFFHGEDEPKVSHLSFTEVGEISDWPQGFFDQYQIDTLALGRARRRMRSEGK